MYNMKIKNKFFFGGLPVNSLILNRQIATFWTILKFFIAIFFLSENPATSGGRLAQFQY